jgi:hypothetical protein
MKIITSRLLVFGLLAVQVSEANAVVCAAGAYHAGCASARGAAVVRRPVGASALSACPASAASTDGGTLDLRGQQLARQGWIAQRAHLGEPPSATGL